MADSDNCGVCRVSRWVRVGLLMVILTALAVTLGVRGGALANLIEGLLGPSTVSLAESYERNESGPDVDHAIFDDLLRKHVREGGWVDYAGLAKDAGRMDEYLKLVAAAPFDRMGRDQKLALLINAYNAFTLRLILDQYPLKSIKDIPSGKRWDGRKWRVGGHEWTLNEIEHEQIRPKFKEPRIHFALVCAAVGCPPLRSEAYRADRLEEQLASQTAYVHAHDRWLRFDEAEGRVGLTSLYKWYGDDFEQVAPLVLDYAARHVPALQRAIERKQRINTYWLDYDWSLNGLENRP